MLPRSCSGELYEILEVDSHCTTADVTQQYRRLALRYHPDRNAGTTVEQFQRIEEAHRVLSDPQQRQLYDTVGRDGLKQLGDYGGGMVGSLLLAVGNVAAGCLLVGVLAAALFASLLIGCFKIDTPSNWPSWGVVLLPLWVLLPILVLASLTVMVASVQRGLYVLLLPSVRLLMCVVIAATTAAALDHRLSPVSAFVPWIIWYVLGTVSDVVMMVPTVYRRTHSPSFSDASTSPAASTANSAQDPFFPGGTQCGASTSTAAAVGSGQGDANTLRSENVSFVETPWRTRRYWRDLTELILEAVCVYAFLALAFGRALQGTSAARHSFESFWVVFTPLFVFFGVHLALHTWEGFFAASSASASSSSSPSSPLNAAAAFQGDRSGSPHHRTDSHSSVSSSGSHPRRPSMGERIANVLLRTFPSACGLYMSAMWAAKAEYEYNDHKGGADPSAFLAFLPILVVLGALAFFVCCGGCLVVCLGSALTNMGENSATATAGGGAAAAGEQQQQQQAHSPAQRVGGRASPNGTREEGYRSTATRTPHAQTPPSPPPSAAPRSTPRRGNAAKDLTIEQID